MFKSNLRQHLNGKQPEHLIKQWFDPLEIAMFEQNDLQKNNAPDDTFDTDATLLNTEINAQKAATMAAVCRVVFPHQLFAQWFMMHARHVFEECVEQCAGKKASIEYSCALDFKKSNSPLKLSAKNSLSNPGPFSFASFIGGSKNNFVLETAQGIARGKINKDICNPFSVWGQSGCGKTHLLKALTQELEQLNNAKILFSTPKELAEQYHNLNSTHLALNMMLGHQAVVIDDLHQIINFATLQDELILLFDHLFSRGKLMAFACNQNPEQMEALNPALRDRLQRGICLELKEADLEVRTEFVRRKSKACHLPFNQKQILSLATQFTSMRKLDGVINKLAAYSYSIGQKASDKDFEKMVRRAGGIALSEVTSSRILEVVSEQMGVSAFDLLGSSRKSSVVKARQIGMYLCRELLNSPYPEIGDIFGGKDQSTALYSVRKIEQLQKVDVKAHKLVTSLKASCLGLKN